MTVKRAFLALSGLTLGFVLGCGLLARPGTARAAKFDCQEAALRPVLGDILDTKDFLRALYAGQASLEAALSAAGATEAEAQGLVQALRACEAPVQLPDAGLTPS